MSLPDLPPADQPPKTPECPRGRAHHITDVDRTLKGDVLVAFVLYADGCLAWRQSTCVTTHSIAETLRKIAETSETHDPAAGLVANATLFLKRVDDDA